MQLVCFIQMVNPSKKRCLFEVGKIGEIWEREGDREDGEDGEEAIFLWAIAFGSVVYV